MVWNQAQDGDFELVHANSANMNAMLLALCHDFKHGRQLQQDASNKGSHKNDEQDVLLSEVKKQVEAGVDNGNLLGSLTAMDSWMLVLKVSGPVCVGQMRIQSTVIVGSTVCR